MLGLGRSARAARALLRALGGARLSSTAAAGPRLLVLGEDLGRALGQRAPAGTELVIDARPRGAGGPQAAVGAAAPVEPDAVLGVIAATDGLVARLADWSRRARDGGVVAVASPAAALLSRPVAAEALTEAFVHAGLIDIEQQLAGRTRVTLGRVRRPPLPTLPV